MTGKIRLLNIIEEFTRECLAIRVSRRLKSIDVINVLSDLFGDSTRCRTGARLRGRTARVSAAIRLKSGLLVTGGEAENGNR
jgi:putative transposase